LEAAGIGVRHAAKLAQIACSTCHMIRAGQVTTIRVETAAAVLGIERPYLAKGQHVPAWQVKRLVRALQGEGYRKQEIARLAGLRPEQLSRDTRAITVRTHLKMLALWQRITRDERGGVFRV
jgi:hypothetical protein